MEQDRSWVKTLVTGTATTLTPETQRRVARWAVKTTMTAEYVDHDQSPVVWPECRRWFTTTRCRHPGATSGSGLRHQTGGADPFAGLQRNLIFRYRIRKLNTRRGPGLPYRICLALATCNSSS